MPARAKALIMMQTPVPLTRDLVLIGGGHTHALLLRMWAMKPVHGVRLTLINPDATAPYSGMLPGMVAGHYRHEDLQIDLVRLARHAGARLVLGRANGIDRGARHVLIDGRAPVHYDIASLDVGITTDLPQLPGFTEYGVPAKPLAGFAARWEALIAARPARARVAVIGAGVAGVELALAAAHRLEQAGIKGHVSLYEAAAQPLRDIGPRARTALLAQLSAQGVVVHTDARVRAVTPRGVALADGVDPADIVIGVAGARPHDWLTRTGLELYQGSVAVGPDLSSRSDSMIYAVGDCAHMCASPRPKAGVFAVRQAPVLLHNLRADLSGGRRRRYRPQRDYLKLISAGRQYAVADKLGLRLEGGWLWRWKDRIDRRFMRKFHALPQMPTAPIPHPAAPGVVEALSGQPPCGGCAAKPGAGALFGALSGLPAPQRDDVLAGAGDDSAVLRAGTAGAQVLSTDHFRAFWDDPWVLGRIAAVHALGDIWAMGAAPQAALAQVTLPHMRERMQQEMLRELLDGAGQIMRAAGADLVGGHTSLGPELTVGFTVTGLSAGSAIGQTGARAGDVLVLSRALGSGIVFAAEMQKRAAGPDVARVLEVLSRSQSAAARALAPSVHAMTDVTGYGLVGHLMGMLRASGLHARLDLAALPTLPGALELAAAGVRSSLDAQNRALLVDVRGAATPEQEALLVDPQTAGGLLAALPEAAAQPLCEAGVVVRIGQLIPGAPGITLC